MDNISMKKNIMLCTIIILLICMLIIKDLKNILITMMIDFLQDYEILFNNMR